MKNLKWMVVLFLGITMSFTNNLAAQGCCKKGKSGCDKTTQSNTQTNVATGASMDSLKVSGVCGMCKNRIEKAAKSVKGIKNAQWNEASHMLVYSFDASVKKEDVNNAIIKVGHDTELGKATDVAYNKLPGCCQYR